VRVLLLLLQARSWTDHASGTLVFLRWQSLYLKKERINLNSVSFELANAGTLYEDEMHIIRKHKNG
jgi:hypothetical protein